MHLVTGSQIFPSRIPGWRREGKILGKNLFHRDALGEVAGLVHVQPLLDAHIGREKI